MYHSDKMLKFAGQAPMCANAMLAAAANYYEGCLLFVFNFETTNVTAPKINPAIITIIVMLSICLKSLPSYSLRLSSFVKLLY